MSAKGEFVDVGTFASQIENSDLFEASSESLVGIRLNRP
jgi:hypothetical protein